MTRANILKAEQNPTKLRRRKLWEGKEGYHCSIIGTCLRRSDIRKLAKKKVFGLSKGLDDFQVHTHFVSLASHPCRQAKILHKLLETKYRAIIRRYNGATNDNDVKKLWSQDINSGAIAGAYWAVMTHPAVSRELRTQIYGEVHMLSHDFFVLNRAEKQGLADLRNKVAMLEEVLSSERQLHRETERKYSQRFDELERLNQRSKTLQTENFRLQAQVELLQSGAELNILQQTMKDIKDELMMARQTNVGQQGRVDFLGEQLDEIKNELKSTREERDGYKDRCLSLQREKEEMNIEIRSLESTLVFDTLENQTDCEHCDDQNTERCPGPGLCGKVILYVGGLSNMVPRYRRLVENLGGQFIHHDGGREISRNQLPKMLHSADAVFCPVDCVSHDATNCVKKICKRNKKPFVMMRSSGLSSLAKGLSEIVQ